MVKTRAGHAPSLRKLRKTTMRGLRAIGAPVESWRANNDLLEVILCSVSIVFGYGLASYISVLLYISAYSIYIKTNTEINELIYIYLSLSLSCSSFAAWYTWYTKSFLCSVPLTFILGLRNIFRLLAC